MKQVTGMYSRQNSRIRHFGYVLHLSHELFRLGCAGRGRLRARRKGEGSGTFDVGPLVDREIYLDSFLCLHVNQFGAKIR